MIYEEVIDTHFHYWDLSDPSLEYNFLNDIDDEIVQKVLKQSYLNNEYEKHLNECSSFKVVKTVHVQAQDAPNKSIWETQFLVNMKKSNICRLSGVVPFIDMRQDEDQFQKEIVFHKQTSDNLAFNGIRHLLHDDDDLFQNENFKKNLKILSKFQLHFEIHAFPKQADDVFQMLIENQNLTFVINHLMCPQGYDQSSYIQWNIGLQKILKSCHPKLYIKISGLIHPFFISKLGKYHGNDIIKYIKQSIQLFGPEKCMFGSNFPVDSVYSNYINLLQLLDQAMNEIHLQNHQRKLILYSNAKFIYKL